MLFCFFQTWHSINENGKLGIKWDLPVDIGLSVHEAAKRVWIQLINGVFILLLLESVGLSFLFTHDELLNWILEVKDQLSNDTVFPLTVGGSIDE